MTTTRKSHVRVVKVGDPKKVAATNFELPRTTRLLITTSPNNGYPRINPN